MSRVDAHAHVAPQAYIDLVPAPGGNLPKPPVVTAEQLLAMMQRYAIDAAVDLDRAARRVLRRPGRGEREARLANEEIAVAVDANRDRFAGLALLPLPDVDAALSELAHALDTMALEGVLLLSHVAGTYLGDPAWERVYAELDRRGAYVFLHPTVPANGVPLGHPGWLYEFPFDTTRALANLIYTGTFERYPNIRWQVAHLGGATAVLAHRIASLAAREPGKAQAAPAGALDLPLAPVLRHRPGQQRAELPGDGDARAGRPHRLRHRLAVLALPEEPGDPAPGSASSRR